MVQLKFKNTSLAETRELEFVGIVEPLILIVFSQHEGGLFW